MDSLGKALITGASSGIGAIYADRLAKRGYDLIVVARHQERLKAVLERISGDTNGSVEVMAADLTNAADLRRVEQALRTDATIELLVNNAGRERHHPIAAGSRRLGCIRARAAEHDPEVVPQRSGAALPRGRGTRGRSAMSRGHRP